MTYQVCPRPSVHHELAVTHLSSLISLLVMPFLLPQSYSTTPQIGLHLLKCVLPAIPSDEALTGIKRAETRSIQGLGTRAGPFDRPQNEVNKSGMLLHKPYTGWILYELHYQKLEKKREEKKKKIWHTLAHYPPPCHYWCRPGNSSRTSQYLLQLEAKVPLKGFSLRNFRNCLSA